MAIDKDRYKQLFLEEAREHLQTLNASLLDFEKSPTNTKPVEKMMRAAHTLKGMAASMGYTDIEKLAHQTEDLFESLRKGQKKATPKLIQNCLNNVDVLEKSIRTKIEKSSSEGIALAQRPEVLEPVTTIKVQVEKLDTLMNLTEQLLVNRMRLGQIASSKDYVDLPVALDNFDRLFSDLQYTVMQARLVPVEQIFNRFPRMVRDLAKKEDKEVELKIIGSEIELDRTLINQIGEPLIHLLRNAVDHGLPASSAGGPASSAGRPALSAGRPALSAGRPASPSGGGKSGRIILSAKREKGIAVITVEDNGRGIDYEKLRIKNEPRLAAGQVRQPHRPAGQPRRLAGQPARDKNAKLQDLLFSGISTADQVTKISGRGVGLKVVKEKVEQVGGTVRVESPLNEKGGTRFTLELPLTLAIARALLVRVGSEKFAIPVADVTRLVRLQQDQIKKTANTEAAVIDDENVPLLRINKILDIKEQEHASNAKNDNILTILTKSKNQAVGFVVDEILSEQNIVIKPLTGILRDEKNFSGATILGDGSVVLILDIANLV